MITDLRERPTPEACSARSNSGSESPPIASEPTLRNDRRVSPSHNRYRPPEMVIMARSCLSAAGDNTSTISDRWVEQKCALPASLSAHSGGTTKTESIEWRQGGRAMIELKRILLPTDFSETA